MSIHANTQALNTSEADYLQMIQRFDQLWARGNISSLGNTSSTEHQQAEMQRLLHRIEQYEQYKQYRDSSGDTGSKVHP